MASGQLAQAETSAHAAAAAKPITAKSSSESVAWRKADRFKKSTSAPAKVVRPEAVQRNDDQQGPIFPVQAIEEIDRDFFSDTRVAQFDDSLDSVGLGDPTSDVPSIAPAKPIEPQIAPSEPLTAEPLPLDDAPPALDESLLGDLPSPRQEPQPLEETAPADTEFSRPTPLVDESDMSLRIRREHAEECRRSTKQLRDRELDDIDLSIARTGEAGRDFPFSCPVDQSENETRQWAMTHFNWTASSLCHKPLYFEQADLERYGHSMGPVMQPIGSAAHFFLTVPVLPYKMGLKTPNECVYPLGHYRPGNCAPYLVPPIPLSLRAATFQAGATVGAILLIP